MYFAVTKITFEEDPGGLPTPPSSAAAGSGRKDLHTLVEKIRARFKVSAAAIGSNDGLAIAIAALGSTEEKLSRTLDGILSFCEESGFGRVSSEETLLDHIDAVKDFTES